MKLEDLPETLTPAVMAGGYLSYVSREGWANRPDGVPVLWGTNTMPESVVHLLEYPARPVGWYHVANANRTFEMVLWWDGADWRVSPNSALGGFTFEDGPYTITTITINEGEN